MKYPKINSLYKRYTSGPFKGQFIDGRDSAYPEFSTDEFEMLYVTQYPFQGFEKIDGTNIRLAFDRISGPAIYGRSDNAQIPSFLLKRLIEIQTKIQIEIPQIFDIFEEIIFFGEGYGAKIQKGGGNYIPDGVDFILFDIWIDGIWLRRESVAEIAEKLELKIVPQIFSGPLKLVEKFVKKGFQSRISEIPMMAEGLVLKPTCDLLDRMGRRIITKIKSKDYQ